MSNTKLPKQTEILAIRMNPQLLNQLNALAVAKHMGTATMARMALQDYLKEQAPNALLGTTSVPQQPQGKQLTPFELSEIRKKQAMSPQERKAYEDAYADDDWA